MNKPTTEITLQVDPELPANIGALITSGFGEFFVKAQELREIALSVKVESVDDKEGMALAKRMRLDIRSIRTGADRARKALKADSLRMGRAIDGAYNILEAAIVPLEEHLKYQEEMAQRLEMERLHAIRTERDQSLADIEWTRPLGDIALMSEENWAAFARDARDLHELRQARARKEEEERLAREKAEREAREEAARKAEEERRRIEEENAKLRAEQSRLEAERRAERERIEAERRKLEEEARIERERIEAERRKEREAAEAKAAKERQAREKAEAEARALREAEERRIREAEAETARVKASEEAAKRKAERAPDKEKLAAVKVPGALCLPVAALKTEAARNLAKEIARRYADLAEWIEAQIESL